MIILHGTCMGQDRHCYVTVTNNSDPFVAYNTQVYFLFMLHPQHQAAEALPSCPLYVMTKAGGAASVWNIACLTTEGREYR